MVAGDTLLPQRASVMSSIQFSIGIMLHVEPVAAKQLFVYQLQLDNQFFLSEYRAFHKQLFANWRTFWGYKMLFLQIINLRITKIFSKLYSVLP